MKKYVAGFLFSEDSKRVALVRKNRPEWQAGRLNAIGGHVEQGESASDAMDREFKEEAGIADLQWRRFCVLEFPGGKVSFYTAHGHGVTEVMLRTMTDEEVLWADVEWILGVAGTDEIIPNLRWLIPLALDKDKVVATVTDLSIF